MRNWLPKFLTNDTKNLNEVNKQTKKYRVQFKQNAIDFIPTMVYTFLTLPDNQ